MPRRDPRDAFLESLATDSIGGSVKPRRTYRARPGAATYLITCAQNNTRVHAELWRNLTAYAKAIGAKVMVSQITYNKSAYLDRDMVKPGTATGSDYDALWYDPAITPFICNDRVALTRALVFCGEVNIIPTAERPLSGFENYTGRSSGIFPHPRFAMQSIAAPLKHPAKFNYTTGAVTLRNYLQRKAGMKAEALHGYGALIVEIDEAGRFWVRQIHATDDGSFQDLDAVVCGGKVTRGNPVEAISWGDVHVAQLDPVIRRVNWGAGGMLDSLRPRYQMLHDTLDFLSRNHHSMRDPHETFRKRVRALDSVEAELRDVAAFLSRESFRPWCKSVVVNSNHDEALMRWLREASLHEDPVNARFYLKAQDMVYAAIERGGDFHLLRALMKRMGVPGAVRFLGQDDSFLLCPKQGGIETGLHGHKGQNGSRGSPRGLSKMGRPVNSGHTHIAGIIDDCYTAGTSSLLDMGYNRGSPSAWSHSNIITYPNARRTIQTTWDGRWRG